MALDIDVNSIVETLTSGKAPDINDKSVSACLIRVLMAILYDYLHNDSGIGSEVSRLLEACKNRKDPMMQELGIMQHQALWAAVNTLTKARAEQNGE